MSTNVLRYKIFSKDTVASQPESRIVPGALLLALALTVLLNAGLLFAADEQYAIIIDAGSSGSRINIFLWKPGENNGIPLVKAAPCPAKSVKGGISSYADNPRQAAKSLKPLIDYALEKIPVEKRGETKLYLMATAGMRRLPEEKQKIILKAIRDYFDTTPFKIEKVKVISGQSEPCTQLGTYQPLLSGDFIAFSGFYYIFSFFETGKQVSLKKFEESGRKFCAMPWEEIKKKYGEDYYLPYYCFKAAHAAAFLHNIYGFPVDDTPNLLTTGDEIGWTLGAMVYAVSNGRKTCLTCEY